VKTSNNSSGRPSALPPTLTATRLRAARLQNRQFLFRTNKPFSFATNFAIRTKQSTSFFLFNTNERLQVTSHPPLFTSFRELCGSAEPRPSSFGTSCTRSGLTPPPRLRTMRRMRQKPCPGGRAGI
jgi:hypothetical protein